VCSVIVVVSLAISSTITMATRACLSSQLQQQKRCQTDTDSSIRIYLDPLPRHTCTSRSYMVLLIGPIPWGHSGPLSRVVVGVVDIDAQAARDSTASDIW